MYTPNVAKQRPTKSVTAEINTEATKKNCWTRRFLCGPCLFKTKQAIRSFQNFLLIVIYVLKLNIITVSFYISMEMHLLLIFTIKM
jgi:hypothetical protein